MERELNRVYSEVKNGKEKKGGYKIDATITLPDVNWSMYALIERLSPFGVGNSKPVFLFENVVPSTVRHFGKDKNHLEIMFKNEDGDDISSIGFFKKAGDFENEPKKGKSLNLVATIERSLFKTIPELRLRIVDVI